MAEKFSYDLLEDAEELSSYRGWSEEVYRDFLAVRCGALSEADFAAKYRCRRAILALDMTGFTSSAMHIGEMASFLRIVDAQRVCIPVMKDHGADIIRCFADDLVAVFDAADAAIDAAFEVHARIGLFNQSELAAEYPTRCCIGIGYGDVFAIGPNVAQGDEMNRASKLGEDVARANETLVTERTYAALEARGDIHFELQDEDDQLFPFYRASLRREPG